MANTKFSVYDYRCSLKTGDEIKVERSIYGYSENLQEELEVVLNSDYEKDLVQLQEKENNIFEDLKNKLDDWQRVAEKIQVIHMAQEYCRECKKVEEMQTTNNEWINKKDRTYDEFDISNKTYKMHIRVYKNTKYKDGKEIPYRWEVSYWIYPNREKSSAIASIDRKIFTDEEKAYKYVEGRKKYFSNYFKELYQPIKKDYVDCFYSCGKLIKNYTVENKEDI